MWEQQRISRPQAQRCPGGDGPWGAEHVQACTGEGCGAVRYVQRRLHWSRTVIVLVANGSRNQRSARDGQSAFGRKRKAARTRQWVSVKQRTLKLVCVHKRHILQLPGLNRGTF